MTGTRKLKWAAAGVVLLAAVAGGSDYDEKKVIATFDGDYAATVGDFVSYYENALEFAAPQDKPVISTFDDAKDFLDDIVTARVLEMEAEALGYGDDENLAKDVETYRCNLLRERVRQKIEDSVEVTEAEVLDYYNKNKEWRRVSFLVCDEKGQCEEAYAELEAGKPWDEVVKEYTIDEERKDTGGKYEHDFYYGGDNVSRAVYGTEVGNYTPVIETEAGDVWLIFRVDEKIPGQEDEYAEAEDDVRGTIKRYKVDVKKREYLEKLRAEADIKVNREVYDALVKGDVAEAKEKYNRKGVAVSDVGGVPVYFESWYEGMFLQLGVGEDGIEEFRRTEPERFKKVMDGRLKALEDDALLEYDAVRAGVDKEEGFIRTVRRFRAGKLVDRIYEEVFVPTVPEATEAEIEEYFESHKDEFQELERAEIEFVAVPKKADAEGLRAKVLAGDDVGSVAAEYIDEYFAALEKEGEPEEEPSPAEMPVSEFLSIPREKGATEPGPGTGSLVDELRPRVFKAKEGDVSKVFKLKDGRRAFFKYVKYSPFVQRTLDEEEIYDRAKDGAYREKFQTPEVDEMCRAWFRELRAKHDIEVDDGALRIAYEKVREL